MPNARLSAAEQAPKPRKMVQTPVGLLPVFTLAEVERAQQAQRPFR